MLRDDVGNLEEHAAIHQMLHPLIAWSVILGAGGTAVVVLRLLQRRSTGVEQLIARACGNHVNQEFLKPNRRSQVTWIIGGAIFLAASFAWLELRQPYYFAQDDALVAELPGMLEGCRGIWAGVWPDYDPCRLMGGPLAPAGVFSLTYPPTYFSYAIARHILHNENALLEVFAALHLAAGYGVTTWLCRRLGMRPMIACCATLSFLLSGSILIMGRSWHAFLPIVVWMPLLMIAVDRLIKRPIGWKWALGTGLSAGILFHVGFPQLWLYAVLFTAFALLFLVVTQAISIRRLLSAWPATVITIGVVIPLLLPQWSAARGVQRPPPYGAGLTTQWIAALLPYPLVKVAHPMGWGSTDVQYMGHFVYFGTVFAALFVLSLLAILVRGSRRAWSQNVWIASAVLALLIATGDQAVLFFLISKIPLVRLVNNNPFRALPFFVLFAVVGAGVATERLLRTYGRASRWANIFAALSLILLAYHVTMARASFYTYGFKPYPPIPTAIADRIEGPVHARMISWTTTRSISPGFAATLPLDLPMLYNIPAFSGYDPLLEWGAGDMLAEQLLAQSPVESLRAYGVRWHLMSPLMRNPILSPNTGVNDEERAVKDHAAMKAVKPLLHFVVHSDQVLLGELGHVSPMAFAREKPSLALPIEIGTGGIKVKLAHLKRDDKIVVNFLWYPQLRAMVDGNRATLSHDAWQRIVVDVPPGAKYLRLRYAAGWTKGIAIGGALFLIGLVGGWIGGRRVSGGLENINIQPPD